MFKSLRKLFGRTPAAGPTPKRSLNHPKVSSITRVTAQEIGLSAAFQDFIFADSRPEFFDFHVGALEYSWTCFIPENISRAYALWSCNADQTLACIEGNELTFWKGYHDDPEALYRAKSEQGLLTHLLSGIYESGISREELANAASFASFQYLPKLVQFYDSLSDESDYTQKFTNLVAQIDRAELGRPEE